MVIRKAFGYSRAVQEAKTAQLRCEVEEFQSHSLELDRAIVGASKTFKHVAVRTRILRFGWRSAYLEAV